MYKIGIIGPREDALPFMALGFSVNEAKNGDQAAKELHRLAKSGEYATIFIIEELAREIEQDIAKYKDEPLPAITVIPGKNCSNGYGAEAIRQAVIRAAGTDLLTK